MNFFMLWVSFTPKHDQIEKKHVTIHWDNIPEDVYEDFCKESSSLNFKTKYEPRSLMHYVWNAWAINDSEPTISLKVISSA